MDYLQNHIWCSESNWDRVHYDCRHLVSFRCFGEDEDDWNAIVDENAERIEDEMLVRMNERLKEKGLVDKSKKYDTTRPVKNFKPHVLKWLEDNVADRQDPDCEKGWCIGSTQYRSTDIGSLTVFFHRKRDAMAFIKEFSKYKKPVCYCQYFTDVRKKLNLETLKYETV